LMERLRQLNSKAEIIECRHQARYLANAFGGDRLELDWLKGRNVVILSGIADPRGFEQEIGQRGATILERCRFADHHRYSQQELIDVINRSARLRADAIITTEKDAVRFPKLERRDVPVYFLRVEIELLSGQEDFHDCIARICFRSHRKANGD